MLTFGREREPFGKKRKNAFDTLARATRQRENSEGASILSAQEKGFCHKGCKGISVATKEEKERGKR